MDTKVLSRSLAALNRRRNRLDENEKGFTLIELLVVVIIIGILAAIAIPVYLGVQNSAKDSGVKSDLTNAKTAVIAYQTDKGVFPDNTTAGQKFLPSAAELGKYGFTQGSNTASITYGTTAATATTFCIQSHKASTAASGTAATDFFMANEASGVVEGKCP